MEGDGRRWSLPLDFIDVVEASVDKMEASMGASTEASTEAPTISHRLRSNSSSLYIHRQHYCCTGYLMSWSKS